MKQENESISASHALASFMPPLIFLRVLH